MLVLGAPPPRPLSKTPPTSAAAPQRYTSVPRRVRESDTTSRLPTLSSGATPGTGTVRVVEVFGTPLIS